MKQRDFDKLNMIRARWIMRKTAREDGTCSEIREDYGVKGMKWGEHKAEEEESASNGSSDPKTEVNAAKAKSLMQAKAQKEADRIGTSTQKIKGDLYVAFLPDSHAGRPPIRAWGKIVDKPTEGYKEYGWDGNFKIYSKGFWGTGDNPSFGYEFVLDDTK